MRASLALEVAGELNSVLSRSRPVLSLPSARARQPSHIRHVTASSNRSLSVSTRRSLSSSAWRQYADNAATATPSPVRQPIPPVAPTLPPKTGAASPAEATKPLPSLTDGLTDSPPTLDEGETQVDWSRSFHGMSTTPFSPEQAAILNGEIPLDDIEIKPDGIIYLPEIKYRRILNKAFGPGGWGLAPRGETIITSRLVTREYALVAAGRSVFPSSLSSFFQN